MSFQNGTHKKCERYVYAKTRHIVLKMTYKGTGITNYTETVFENVSQSLSTSQQNVITDSQILPDILGLGGNSVFVGLVLVVAGSVLLVFGSGFGWVLGSGFGWVFSSGFGGGSEEVVVSCGGSFSFGRCWNIWWKKICQLFTPHREIGLNMRLKLWGRKEWNSITTTKENRYILHNI